MGKEKINESDPRNAFETLYENSSITFYPHLKFNKQSWINFEHFFLILGFFSS